jgi:hypothetical protein
MRIGISAYPKSTAYFFTAQLPGRVLPLLFNAAICHTHPNVKALIRQYVEIVDLDEVRYEDVSYVLVSQTVLLKKKREKN